MLKGFLFDLDGTIWDSERVIVKTISQTALETGAKITESEIKEQFKNAVSPIEVLRSCGVSTELYWENYRKNFSGIDLFFSNTSDILGTLAERKKFVGFITALKKEFTLALLEKFDLMKYAQVLITPSDCRTAKPSPASINMALSKLPIGSTQFIYIGDQDSDIVAARRAGCKSGLAKWGMRRVSIEKPDYTLEKLEDVLPLSLED